MNDVDVTSAGSLVAAVLETAGYVTQQNFLDWYGSFFWYTGELLFIFSCIGGLVSVILFGSYKMARYLILGPSLFFFCLYYTVETDGVIWRMGNEGRIHLRDKAGNQSEAQDKEKASLEVKAAATTNRSKVLQDIKNGSLPPADTIKISGVFHLYTNTINNIVAEFVDLVLQIGEKSNNDDLALINNIRGQVMETIMSAAPEKRGLVTMIEDDLFSTACGATFSLAVSAGVPELHQEAIDQQEAGLVKMQAENPGNTDVITAMTQALAATKLRKEKIEELAKSKQNIYHKPTPDMLAFMRAHLTDLGDNTEYLSGTQKAIDHWTTEVENWGAADAYTDAGFRKLASRIEIKCEHVRDIVMDAIMEDAQGQVAKYVKDGLFPGDVPTTGSPSLEEWGQEKLCKSIAIKFGGELANFAAGQGCDLSRIYGIFLIRNSIGRSGMSRSVTKMKNRFKAIRPTQYHARNYAQPIGQTGDAYLVKKHETVWRNGVPGMEFINKTKQREEWTPLNKVAFIGDGRGPMEVLKTQQSYQTRELRQEIYSYSLKIPYYQGVLLYLLAATYPFLCLLLLMPGKAAIWLQLPLAWLWVKSWDVGFAACLVLENVLWNLFPRSDLYADYSQKSVDEISNEGLSTLLQDGLKIDFTYDVHAYYLMMSMSLTSVPILTGYATLKARRAILASFTQAASSSARQLGKQVSGAYGKNVINKMMQRGKMLTGMAHGAALMNMQQQMQQPQSLFTGAAGQGANGWGTNQPPPMNNLPKQTWKEGGYDNEPGLGGSSAGDIGGIRAAAKALLTTGKSGKALTSSAKQAVDTLADFMKKEVDYKAKRARMLDPTYGRYGTHRKLAESFASSVDGQDGFEINDAADQFNALYRAGVALNIARWKAFLTIQKEVQKGAISRNPLKGPMSAYATVAEGKDIKELFDSSLKAVTETKGDADKIMTNMQVVPLTSEQLRQIEEKLEGEDGLSQMMADTSQRVYGGLTGRQAVLSYYGQKILQITPERMAEAERQGAVSTSFLPEGYKMVTKMVLHSNVHDKYFKEN